VKPENVIIRREGTPGEEAVLIDFSIAIVKDAAETLHGLSRAAGGFDYMAPEQAVGYADSSSDIYSLAKLAIEMLTGRQLRELLPTQRWTCLSASGICCAGWICPCRGSRSTCRRRR